MVSVYAAGNPTRAVNTFFVVKPGFMLLNFVTLLIVRPAATSRPHESAISNMTSPRLMRPMRKLDAPRDLVLQNLVDVGARRLQRRDRAGHERRQDRDGDGEQQHLRVQPDVDEEGDLRDGERAVERADPEIRDADAEHRGDERQHQRFGEELSHDVRARRAERGADPDLLGAMGRAIEQEVGDVGAGDQQYEEHRAEHRVEQLPRLVPDVLVDERRARSR